MTKKTKQAPKAPQRKARGIESTPEIERKAEPSAFAESSLRERALLARYSVGRWYGQGIDQSVSDDVRKRAEAEGDVGSFNKRIMRKERLAEINAITTASRAFHKTMTLPWGDSGSRLISVDAYRAYKERMSRYEHEFNMAVESFIRRFPEFVQEERRMLGKLWRESDYPTESALRERFRFGLIIEPLPDASDLRVALSREQAEEIKRELEENLHRSFRNAIGDIYARIAEQVQGMKERLDDPDAQLRRSMIEGLIEQMDLLPKLNILHDPEITKLGAQIRRDLCAVSVQEIKDAPEKRAEVAKKAASILGVIERMQKKGA